jgi:hypothetical protein
VRHAADGASGAMIGAKVEKVLGTSAADNEREKAPPDGVESFASDAAQQLSAWVCVTTLSDPPPDSVDPCIGQSPLSEQQAMRASGEACQPAHSAHPAAPSARATTKAAVRLSSNSTILGCTGATAVSIQSGTGAQRCAVLAARRFARRTLPAVLIHCTCRHALGGRGSTRSAPVHRCGARMRPCASAESLRAQRFRSSR